jgi:hypothetical protein
MLHFLVRETHKVVCANRDGKKKPQILKGEKKMKKLFLGTVSHIIREPAPSRSSPITFSPYVVKI